jgi:hypothetical protein
MDLMDQTAAVQALRGTATGPEVLLIVCDPAVNEWFDDASRSSATVIASLFTLVDFYRANGWAPTDGRRIAIANCLSASIFLSRIEAFNAALAAADWQSRADRLIDVSAVTADLGDSIHLTETNASDMAALMSASLSELT